MAGNFFDQFDGERTADGRPSITVRPIRPGYDNAIASVESGGNYRAVGPAAKAWFAGEGGMNDPNRKDVLGTTVAGYGRKFMNALGPQTAEATPAKPQQAQNFFDQFDGTAPPAAQSVTPQRPDSRPDIGRGRAIAEGLRSGITSNFGDELAGVAGAAGTPEELRSPLSGPSDAIIGLAKLGYEYLTGGDTAAKRYAASRDAVRSTQKAAEEQYPGSYMAGQIGGAVALPLGGALNAATLLARMGRGAALGTVTGAAAGAGEGTTIEDRASRAAIGSAVGGAIGAVAPPLVEGGAKLIGAAVSTPINMLRAAANPTGAAERAVGRAYNEAATIDPSAVNRLAPSELVPGGPQAVMDTLGQPGRNLARSAANISGGAKDTLNQTLDPRFESQGARLTQWLRSTFNYPDAHGQQQAIDKVEKTVNRANYGRAYKDGDKPILSPVLERFFGSPAVQDAIRSAITTGKDRAITEGFGGFRSPFTITPDGRLTFNRGPNGVPTYPNLQFWDYTRRELSNAAKKAERAGGMEDASRLGDLSRALNKELDRLVPSYQDARQGAAKFFGAENALEAGQKFVTENFALPQTRAALAKMSPMERQLFQDGFVSRYMEVLDKVPDRADVVRRIYNTPDAKQRFHLVLGPQRAAELETVLRVENIMQQGLRAVQGHSTTALQLITAGAAGAGGGGYLGFDPTTSGIAAALAAAGKRGIDQRVAQNVAEMLTSSDPAVLNRGIKMIASNQRLLGVLRSADSASVRVGSSQGGPAMAPSLQAPAIGRAEDDKPVIPRPPGQ